MLRLSAQTFALGGKESQNIAFEYQGSILSALKDSELPAPLLAFRDAMRRVRSLELLSPEKLRKSARVSEHDIGAGGEKLSAYLDNIKGEQKIKLVELLKSFTQPWSTSRLRRNDLAGRSCRCLSNLAAKSWKPKRFT